MTTRLCALVVLGCGLLASGCGRNPIGASSGGPGGRLFSPLPGKWVGQAKLATGNDLVKLKDALSGGKMTGDSTLTLNGDGTGSLKVARQPERPVTWRQEGRKVILLPGAGGSGSSDSANPGWVATLSDDSRSLSIDMGDVRVDLSKVPGAR